MGEIEGLQVHHRTQSITHHILRTLVQFIAHKYEKRRSTTLMYVDSFCSPGIISRSKAVLILKSQVRYNLADLYPKLHEM